MTGCLERCRLIPTPLSHVQMPPRAQEEKRGHVQHSAPLGPGSLCLSTPKILLNMSWIREKPGKDPIRGCTEDAVGPQLCGMMG